jgi:SAM-dependent methyltransferase
MSVIIAKLKKTYTKVPDIRIESALGRVERILCSTLFPLYLLRSRLHGIPGLRFPLDSARLALRSLIRKHDGVSDGEIYRMLFTPVESTRYFEFGLAWEFLSDMPIERYLDVSSPRLFPLALVAHRSKARAELINPTQEDLKLTAALVRSCGLADRCTLWNSLIEEAPFPPNTFDLITSLSVIEHIPADKNALQRMWDLLKPAGRLVVSVPCAGVAEEQHIDVDHFGLQRPDENGFFFLQYVYDDALLHERFYSVLGSPKRHGIYGENERGSLRRGLIKKWSGAKYPRWKEPYKMAQEFQQYQSVRDLPGEGVIVMEFEKK